MRDSHNLQRFVDAQERVYRGALAEIGRGRKSGHWMWFIFPQIAGLGASSTSQRYAISSLDEAQAYLNHPLLGSRLTECVKTVNQLTGRTAAQIFGFPDVLKLRSSLTLFEAADPSNPHFSQALEKYYEGKRDEATLQKLASSAEF